MALMMTLRASTVSTVIFLIALVKKTESKDYLILRWGLIFEFLGEMIVLNTIPGCAPF